MKIGMVSVIVNNPLEAFRFYTQVLGFVERLYKPEMRIAIVVAAEQPEGTALLLEPNDDPIARTFQQAVYGAGLPVIVFAVADVRKECRRLKERGVVFKKPPTENEWGIEAVFDDTCGNLIQLHQAKS
jgi:predicted enzyme related to lactoylglutathione lyase